VRLAIEAPAEAALEHEVGAAAAGEGDCVVKIILTRGAGERGYPYGHTAPTRIVLTAPLPRFPETYSKDGVKARVCDLRLALQPALAGVKHLNRLENVLARAEWSDPEIVEGILCDSEGNAIGGTMSNVFMVKAQVLVTPALDRCGVAGVTRDRVCEAAEALGIRCVVRALPIAELCAADEVFLVNSVIGLWPVRSLDSRSYARGPATERIQGRINATSDARVA
jgi:4-amino-4-deoxychorismate lyase